MRASPVLRRLNGLFLPAHLRARFRPLPDAARAELRDTLVRRYFAPQYGPEYVDTAEGRLDLWIHLVGRVDVSRTLVVPWLDDARPLRGARVLEIGSGTGGGTVALAEQGAQVTCVDVQRPHMEIARRRCELYGVEAELVCANADALARELRGRSFDLVVFFAALEHMTLDERLSSLAAAFELLSSDGVCAVLDAPNRLWPLDDHTAMEPFFHWLPDELALRVGASSPRAIFARWCAAPGRERTDFARWGRGVSYHEFELALGRGRFEVVSTFERYWRRDLLRRLGCLCSRACRVLERMEGERAMAAPAARAGAEPSAAAGPAGAARPSRSRGAMLRSLLARARAERRRARVDRSCKRVLRAFARPDVDDGFLDPWLQLVLRPIGRQLAAAPVPIRPASPGRDDAPGGAAHLEEASR